MTAKPLLPLGPQVLERMVQAVEKVRERLERSTAALEAAQVPYVVIGGNAVAAWVARVDEGAVRNTADVDLLIRRTDLPAAIVALTQAGFIYHETLDVHMFLDGPLGTPRQAIHVLLAGEKVQNDYALPTPDVTDAEQGPSFRMLTLEALVQMKLTSFRDKDRTHLRDLIEVGLIDVSWVSRFPAPLSERLQLLFDTPNG